MSIPAITRPLGDNSPLDTHAYSAGINDALDEHAAGATPDVLFGRADWMTQHLSEQNDQFTAYALGYSAAVIALRANTDNTAAHSTEQGAAA